jgi:hypothetical protein
MIKRFYFYEHSRYERKERKGNERKLSHGFRSLLVASKDHGSRPIGNSKLEVINVYILDR